MFGLTHLEEAGEEGKATPGPLAPSYTMVSCTTLLSLVDICLQFEDLSRYSAADG